VDSWIAHTSRAIIVISDRFAGLYRQQRGVAPERVHVVPNWADDRALPVMSGGDEIRAEMDIPREACLLVYGGNVGVAAGVEGIIHVFANWPTDEPRPYFLIAGAGPCVDSCRLAAAQIEGDLVRFYTPWPAEKTGAVYEAADILILPTQGQQSLVSVPSKLIYYMLAGRPVIAQAVPGSDLAQTIEKAGCGWVIEPNDSEALATMIRKAMALPAHKRFELGNAGRLYALHHLTRSVCLPRVVSLLEQNSG